MQPEHLRADRAVLRVAVLLALLHVLYSEGTVRIDRIEARTGDEAFFAWQYYSDKVRGTAAITLPFHGPRPTGVELAVDIPPFNELDNVAGVCGRLCAAWVRLMQSRRMSGCI